ncbi:MAG: PorV/PorQ family protein [Elusimicrobiota bacterium]
MCSSSLLKASGAGTSGGAFLKIPAGARASGMGESFTAVSGDADSVFINPAGLASVSQVSLSLNYMLWIEDTAYGNVSFIYPGVWGGNLGLGVGFLSVPSTKVTLEDLFGRYAGEKGSFDAGFYNIVFSYSRELKEELSAGASLKIIHESLYSYSSTAFAMDAGVLGRNVFSDNLDLALVACNIGTPLKVYKHAAPLPLGIRTGAYYSVREDLNLMTDMVYYRDSGLGFNVGGEYLIHSIFTLRGGYTFNNTVSKEPLRGLRIGWGLSPESFIIDYAYIPAGVLGSNHSISLKYSF